MKYTRYNFHNHTFCRFTRTPMEFWANITPNYVSKSGSAYYFTDQGVYRLSNHWGRAANCKWRLEGPKTASTRTELGYATWQQFYPDYPSEALYWIGVDQLQHLHYYHKNCPEYAGQPLFTANQIQKLLRKYRDHFKNKVVTTEALEALMNR